MTHLFRLILTATLFTASVFGLTASDAAGYQPGAEVTCSEARQNAFKLTTGIKAAEVKALLGEPSDIEKGVWVYNFLTCSPPPGVGEQTVVGLTITFTDGAISKIDYAAVCSTGPPVGRRQPAKSRN